MQQSSNSQNTLVMHGALDRSLFASAVKLIDTTNQKYWVVQERDVSYQASLHAHPYVGELVRRLIRQGVRGLQSADTEYVAGRASLPESVEVALGANAALTVPTGTRLILLADTTATLSGGATMALAASMQVRASAPAAVTAPDGMHAILVNGMSTTPAAGSPVTLPAQPAFLPADAAVVCRAATAVTLFNGKSGTLPVGTRLLAARFTEFGLSAATAATVLDSRPVPVLYHDLMTRFAPTPLVERPRPARDLDFRSGGAYAVYNWELFFHVPLMMAAHLMKNQHFAEAQQWLHHIFDPTDDSDGPTPERFWKVRPFQTTDVKKVEQLLVNLATGADPALQEQTADSIDAWQRDPFRPHVIARFRQQAYMYKTVMLYLDNLIAWGDSLFAQDSGETVDEALNLYMLAASLLGPRPQAVPAKGTTKPQTYANLRKDLHKFGTVMRDVEAEVAFDLMPLPADSSAGADPQAAMVRSLGKALYFSVPRNDKLMGYWDTVADRVFKIRNSLNLQGVFRQLALFDPPLDPALLARAAAAGLDIASVVNGLNQPLPLVRYQVLAQKAAEIVQEVKALGLNLLAAIEKEDGETLALLRTRHERALLLMVEQVRYAQLQEAGKAREALEQSLVLATHRYAFYERQLGASAGDVEKAVPALSELDADGLAKLRFAAAEDEVALREIDVDIATDAFAQAAGALVGGRLLSSHEVRETFMLEAAQIAADIGSVLAVASSVAAVVPQFEVSAEPWGMGGATSFGGQNVASGIQAGATAASGIADRLNFEARRAGRIDAFARREREWALQSNLAALDINQIFKQLRAAQLREAVAGMELANHRKQMTQAADMERFLNESGTERMGKVSNKALYTWLKRETRGLYAQAYQFAFDVARKAERALQHELGDTSLRYLANGYLSGKEGLLAGERLLLDLKRMDLAYLELNRREYELTKHVSLSQVDPQALIELRTTGRATVSLDEALFNVDGPSHYFRRIRTVAVSVPCVSGPYAGVSCTLTLQRSSIRVTPVVGDGDYARGEGEDARFSDYYGSTQAVVTSSGLNDPALFDANLRDERLLPFEYAGVISTWQLRLPADPSAGDPTSFDYDTISDVVLHLRYTAREGGDILRTKALADLKERITTAQAVGSRRLFSLRHDFPDAWAAFRSAPTTDDVRPLELRLTPRHFPYWSRTIAGTPVVRGARLVVRASGDVKVSADSGLPNTTDNLGTFVGDLKGTVLTNAPMPVFDGDWKVRVTDAGNTITDAWLLVDWGGEE